MASDKKIDLTHFDKAKEAYDTSAFSPETPGKLESAALGALQGASFGFADEAEAGLRSAVQDKTYDDLIREIRQRYSAAENENPLSFTAGQLAGGVAVPMGGVGVAAKGAGTVAKLANLAKAGAVAGAATSLGTREDDKLSLQAAEDALKGGVVGAATAATLGSAVPAAAKYIGKKVKGSSVGQDVADVFNKIKSGEVETFDRSKLPDFSNKVREAAKTDILGNLEKADEYTKAGYNNAYKLADEAAEASGEKIPTSDLVSSIRAKMPQAELQGVEPTDLNKINKNLSSIAGEEKATGLDNIEKIISTREEVTPKELNGYIQNIQRMYDSAQNPQFKALLLDSKKELENALRSGAPEDFNKAKAMLGEFYKTVLDAKSANLKLPGSFDTSPEGRKASGQAVDSIQRMITDFSKKETQPSQNLTEFLNKLKSVNAEEIGLSSTGKTGPATIPEIEQNLQNVSRNYELAQKAASQSSLAGASTGVKGLMDKLQLSARAKMLGTAEGAAKLSSAAENTYNKMASSIQHYTPEMLSELAGKVKDSGLANILTKAATAPDAKRKALIFTLMQQPAYRDMINTANTP